MAARDDLQVFANNTVIDPIEGTPNKLSIGQDLWDNGWLFQNPVAGQHLNQILYLLTSVVKNDTLAKTQNLNDVLNKSAARTNLDLLQRSQNFADVPDKAAARTNLGLDIDTLYNTFFDRMHPVGTIYTVTGVATNPSTLLGRGTWVATGQGRVLVGEGTGSDSNGFNKTVSDGQTFGEYQHTMTQNELASHSHGTGWPMYGENGEIQDHMASGGNSLEIIDFDLTTQSAGSSTPFNVCQPSLGVYFWKRTA